MNKEIIQYWTPDFDEGLYDWHIETIMSTLDSLLLEYPNAELKVIGDLYSFDKKKQYIRLNDLKILEKSMNKELFNDLYSNCDLRKNKLHMNQIMESPTKTMDLQLYMMINKSDTYQSYNKK